MHVQNNQFNYSLHCIIYLRESLAFTSYGDRGGVILSKALYSNSLQISLVLIKWVKSAVACVLN